MTNLRKAAQEYAKTIWSELASEEEVEQTCEDFIVGYGHAMAVLGSKKAKVHQDLRDREGYTPDEWADFLSQHAASAPEGDEK
jgi:hypothetical protein